MKIAPLSLACVLLAAAALGEESRSSPAAPQPRPKLDPLTRAATERAATETKIEPAAPAMMMDRFVVRGIAAIPFVQRKEPVLHREFTPLRGGSFLERKFGKTSVFIGIKPWFDLFEEDARFKHPPTGRINFTLFELSR